MSAPTRYRRMPGTHPPPLISCAGTRRHRRSTAASPLPPARPGLPEFEGQDHRRLGRGEPWRRHRQGQRLSRRLARHGREPEACGRGLGRRRGSGAGLLSRYGELARFLRMRRRLGRLVVAGEYLRIRPSRWLERDRTPAPDCWSASTICPTSRTRRKSPPPASPSAAPCRRNATSSRPGSAQSSTTTGFPRWRWP